MALTEKFKKDISTLRAAADGDIFLDVKNPNFTKRSAASMKIMEWCFQEIP